MSETDDVVTAPGELLLDPFGYHPDQASAIRGLGGGAQPSEPTYALHTNYVRVAEGPASFTLRFDGLFARLGTLQLRVHMFVEGPPTRFLLANTVRIQFNRLIQLGGEMSIHFEGMKGVQFALHGAVLGETDAEAAGLTITLDRPAAEDDEATPPSADLRNTEFGAGTTRPVPMLLAAGEPTLASPVSQLATAAQAREPVYAEWRQRVDLAAAPEREAWSAAYVLQAIRAYGLLRDGARGLGFGANAERIAAVVREMGGEAAIATLPDLPERLPRDLVDFDVLWTIDATAANGIDLAPGHIEALMRCLRPGGLAVHVLPFEPGRDQRHPDTATLALRRGEVERLALTMISRGVETAQLKIDGEKPLLGDAADGPGAVGAFGLVLRKAPLSHA